jgi:glycosyltransferase involved in cell wall biosynthesis
LPRTVLYTICYSDFYGAQRSVLSTAANLDPGRYAPVVAAPHGGGAFFGALAAAGVHSVPLPFKNVFDAETLRGLCRVIREKDVELIHAHLGISAALSIAASALSRNIPVVVSRHFIEDRYTTIGIPALFRVYRGIYHIMNSRVSRVIFVSEAVRKGVEEREGPLGPGGVVIPNGVRPADFAPARQARAERAKSLKSNLGFPEDCFLVATLSRLAAEKGLDVLIRAAAELCAEQPDMRFLIAGGGKLLAELESLAAESNVADKIKFAGYIGGTADVLAAADVFALCAHAEPFGIAILEAMAAGLPVIAARAGGPLDIIHDGVDGVFFNPRDPRDLAEKIRGLRADPALRKKIADGAVRRADDFDERFTALRIQSLYDEILGG